MKKKKQEWKDRRRRDKARNPEQETSKKEARKKTASTRKRRWVTETSQSSTDEAPKPETGPRHRTKYRRPSHGGWKNETVVRLSGETPLQGREAGANDKQKRTGKAGSRIYRASGTRWAASLYTIGSRRIAHEVTAGVGGAIQIISDGIQSQDSQEAKNPPLFSSIQAAVSPKGHRTKVSRPSLCTYSEDVGSRTNGTARGAIPLLDVPSRRVARSTHVASGWPKKIPVRLDARDQHSGFHRDAPPRIMRASRRSSTETGPVAHCIQTQRPAPDPSTGFWRYISPLPPIRFLARSVDGGAHPRQEGAEVLSDIPVQSFAMSGDLGSRGRDPGAEVDARESVKEDASGPLEKGFSQLACRALGKNTDAIGGPTAGADARLPPAHPTANLHIHQHDGKGDDGEVVQRDGRKSVKVGQNCWEPGHNAIALQGVKKTLPMNVRDSRPSAKRGGRFAGCDTIRVDGVQRQIGRLRAAYG
ncbi:hypothetical protein B0H13DRAFT_1874100 [Mycena leptocephala]|nr:hypothetical protein B0H13DRAFT_1874100 [Mycena leptocephala]